MSDSPQYEAFRAFARSEIRAQRLEFKAELASELRAEFKEILTREVPPALNYEELEQRVWERIVPKLPQPPVIPPPVKGDKGDKGEDGIGTLEDLKAAAQEVFADFQVRTFADIYTGVYKPGESYTRSQFTTWGGSLWLALTDTRSKPGETPDWKLVVKK